MSLPMLANKYHKCQSTIHKHFVKNGLKCRSHSEKSRKYECNYNYFDVIDSDDKAYFLGFIYADGYITENQFGIAIASRDIDILEKLLNSMESTHKIHIYENNGYGGLYKNTEYARVIIRNDHLVESLIANGVVYRKSKVLMPPNIEEKYIRHFIRGYMDGDGSISKSHGTYTVGFVGTRDVLKYIGDHIKSKGIIKRYSIESEHNSDSIFCLRIGGNIQAKKLLDYLYMDANTYLNRKHDIYLRINN